MRGFRTLKSSAGERDSAGDDRFGLAFEAERDDHLALRDSRDARHCRSRFATAARLTPVVELFP